VGNRVRRDGVQRADLREGRPLPLAALRDEAQRGGVLEEDGRRRRAVGGHDRAEPRAARYQEVGGDRHPRGEREPRDEPSHSFVGVDLCGQRRGCPAGGRAEPRAEGAGAVLGTTHRQEPGLGELAQVDLDQIERGGRQSI